MRTVMGPRFDTLQRAVVEAGFTGYRGEPDLFCYSDDGTWFFAEAKTPDDFFRDSQRRWFSIAETLPDSACPVFRCQIVPEGFPIVAARHSDKWLEMMAARQIPAAAIARRSDRDSAFVCRGIPESTRGLTGLAADGGLRDNKPPRLKPGR